MNAYHDYGRIRWMRGLGGYLFEHLGAEGPHWLPDRPIYFLTVIDKEQVHYPKNWPWSPQDQRRNGEPIPVPDMPGFYEVQSGRGPDFEAIRRSYSGLLPRDLNYVGMIDVTYYTSVCKVLGHNIVLLPHVHCLVWGISAEELAAVCKAIGKQIKPLLPYATAAEFERVRDGDLLQMLWYVCKTPYKQYQVWQGENSLRQWKRDLNGVNSVRLYAELRNATLDQLTLAGGEGRAFLKALRRDIQGWQQNARAKGYI